MKVLWLLSALAVARAQFPYDAGVCTPDTLPKPVANPPMRPSFANITTFEARIEANLLEKNLTKEFTEYFDYNTNRGAITEYEPPGMIEKAIYNYDTNEILISMPYLQNLCYVENLAKSSNKFIFGYKKKGDKGQIFSVAGALRFGGDNVKEVYMGQEMVRGITADRWDSCLKWNDQYATMKVSWYFSSATNWNTALGLAQVPLRAIVDGSIRTPDGFLDHNFKHYYDFIQYRPIILSMNPEKHFETPKGAVCKGRKNTKQLPTPPTHFQLSSEVIVPEFNIVGYSTEYYDFEAKLFRNDYKPLPLPNYVPEFGQTSLTEIHDFNTGVQYIIDRQVGNCTIRPIPTGTDAARNDANTVRIKTAQEFFNFDAVDYTYTGVRRVRDIDAFTWIGKGVNSLGINTTYEWFFTSDNWVQNTKGGYEVGDPLRMELSLGEPALIHYIYNYFKFSRGRPALWNYDIGNCYATLRRERFRIVLPGSYKDTVAVNLELFKNYALTSIAGNAGVSPLRITQMMFTHNREYTNIFIHFMMLDKAPIKGSVTMAVEETSIDIGAELLREAVDTSQFKVVMDVDNVDDPVVLTAIPGSLRSTAFNDTNIPTPGECDTETDSGTTYKPGHLAGVAVGMIVGGFLLGFVIIYIVYRKNGGTLRTLPIISRFDNPNFDKPVN